MSWRERAREIQKCPSGEVSKGSKDPFAPFETTGDGHSESFQREHASRRDEHTSLLTDFQAALVLGRLVVCANCADFHHGAEPAGLGQCQRFATGAWPFVPFACGGFAVSPTAAAPAYLPDPDGARAIARLTGRDPVYVHRRAP